MMLRSYQKKSSGGGSRAAPASRGFAGAPLLGMLFGPTSLPLAGPVLLTLLAILPTTGLAFGALLLAAYGLGHCVLIIGAGTSVGLAERALAARGLRRAPSRLKGAGGHPGPAQRALLAVAGLRA